MKNNIRVALAAYGMSGRVFHAPFISTHPGFELAMVLERSQRLANADYPAIVSVSDYEDILQDETIDLVVVNTPNALHYPMAKSALLAGKHVVVEKPFTPTLAEGEELIALAEKKQLLLSVYHNRCLASGYRTAKMILEKKLLGDLRSFTINIDRYRPQPGPKKWKEEQHPAAGLLYDMGVHLLDEALMLFGDPQFVAADLRVQRSSGLVNDYFSIRLDYKDFHVNLQAGLLAREAAPAYILHGEQGSYVKLTQDVQESHLLQGVSPVGDSWREEAREFWGVLHNDSGRAALPTVAGDYRDFYNNLYAALGDKSLLLTTPQRALRIMTLLERVIESGRLGCKLPVHFLVA